MTNIAFSKNFALSKKTILMTLVFAVMFVVLGVSSAFAATSGSDTKTCTINVSTKANYWLPGQESITISQTQGTMYSNSKHTKTFKQYGYYNIVAKPQSGSSTKTVKATLSGSSVKLNLAPNTVYKVTISWDSFSPQNILGTSLLNTGFGWKSYPSWKVSSSCKCTYY